MGDKMYNKQDDCYILWDKGKMSCEYLKTQKILKNKFIENYCAILRARRKWVIKHLKN